MSSIRTGLKQILDNLGGDKMYSLTRLINWHDMMDMVELRFSKRYDLGELKAQHVDYVDCDITKEEDKPMLEAFWQVLEEYNFEDRKAFFNFNSGMSRVGPPHSLNNGEKMVVRLDANMAEDALPQADSSDFSIVLPKTFGANVDTKKTLKQKLLEAMEKDSDA